MLRPIYTAGVTIVTSWAATCRGGPSGERASGGRSSARHPPSVLASARQVLLPALQHDLLVLHQVLHDHGPLHHARERAGAGVLRQPLGAADGRGAVAPARAEAALHRAEQLATRAPALERSGAARPHLARALEVAAAGELHLGQPLVLLALALMHRELALREGALLDRAGAVRGERQADRPVRRVHGRPDRDA